ncbi:nucleolar complex-associated protein-domain-containing protein [Hyaloraphidium curvatum]|nr:nucleolar complex-associated protein-domain-containing protein [Hyaloraphidium curvatum]
MRKKRKIGKRAPLPKRSKPSSGAAEPEEDVELSGDDLEFLAEYGSGAGFLNSISKTDLEKPLPKKKLSAPRRVPEDSDSASAASDEEAASELENGESDIASDSEGAAPSNDAVEENKISASVVSSEDDEVPEPRKRRKAPPDDDQERDFEKLPRAAFRPKNLSNRLPIKLADGSIAYQNEPVPVEQIPSATVEEPSETDSEPGGATADIGAASIDVEGADSDEDVDDPEVAFATKKEKLARLASGILEDPEGKVASLKALLSLTSSPDGRIKRLGMLTQLAVYRDIVPGYRIRPRTEAEKQIKLSKEVKKRQNFEESIVSSYQSYVQLLEKTAKAFCSLTRQDISQLNPNTLADLKESAVVAVRCQTALLISLPHFNYRSELLHSVVARMAREDGTSIGASSCAAIVQLFENDVSGEVSLEAVKAIAKMVKERHFRVGRRVLDTFLHLKLDAARRKGEKDDSVAEKKPASKPKVHVSKFQRKMAKQQKEVERTLKEAEAEVSMEEKAKQQTETLKHVFLAYFRVLRACRDRKIAFWTDTLGMDLVLSTLDGLSRYTHMIDVDFFTDLLGTLKDMAARATEILRSGDQEVTQTANQRRAALLVSIRACVAAIQILGGQGEALNIDLKDFADTLYGAICDVCFVSRRGDGSGGNQDDPLVLLLRGLELFLLKRKEPALDRVAAFGKRVLTASLQLDEQGAAACLAFVRSLLVRYPKLASMMEPDDKVAGQGVYLPEIPDPDIAHGLSSTFWELALHHKSFHPAVGAPVAAVSDAVSSHKAKSGPAAWASDPSSFLTKPLHSDTGSFDPPAFPKQRWREAGPVTAGTLDDSAFVRSLEVLLAQ